MPFKSSKQRRFFHALKNDPNLRKTRGVRLSEVNKMLDHERGEVKVAGRTRKALRAGG